MQDGELGVWSKRQVCSIIPSQQILNYKQLGVKAIFGTNNISCLPNKRGGWWDKLALHLERHLNNPAAAASACKAGIDDPYVRTGHKLSLLQRGRRICKMVKHSATLGKRLAEFPEPGLLPRTMLTVTGIAVPSRGIGHSVVYRDGDVLCSVEELVLRRARHKGWDGLHCEGRVLTTIYGLLLWDVIFMPVKDTMFTSPFQFAPLDFHTAGFYARRTRAIEARLREIEQHPTIGTLVEKSWALHHGQQCSGVSWDAFGDDGPAVLSAIVSGLGSKAVTHICRLFAQDYGHRHAGVPDCILWRPVGRTHFESAAGDAGDAADAAPQGDDVASPGSAAAATTAAATSPPAAAASTNGAVCTDGIEAPPSEDLAASSQIEVEGAQTNAPKDGNGVIPMECMFVEVKSPNDRLSEKQLIWLHALQSFGVQAAVCNVVHCGGDADVVDFA